MIKYDNGTNPLQAMIDGYEERGKSQPFTEPASDSLEVLRKQYEKNPDVLSPIQLLTIGMADLNNKYVENKRKAVEEAPPARKEEMISTNSKEFQELERQLKEANEQLNQVMSEREGGGSE
ncbi:hypothetical protein [Mesobacillus maritimus]|uniref:Transposase n=1 Tax=Mesobacillus maritimus TaxID=1643336 RepID=A0ABS7K8U0_9BACI|nr:hypothetical protein [Mesobacillus maritimus]MBY0098673.1 hypothetical protein [Mesobacillus maritimus]